MRYSEINYRMGIICSYIGNIAYFVNFRLAKYEMFCFSEIKMYLPQLSIDNKLTIIMDSLKWYKFQLFSIILMMWSTRPSVIDSSFAD